MRCVNAAAALACAAVLLAGCASEPKRPASKPAAKPAATASKPRSDTRTPAKAAAKAPAPAAKPVPKTPQERYAMALDYLKTSQWQEAETALLASAKELSQYSGPHTNLGILYARTNRKPQATAAFTKAVNVNSKNAAAYTWLGVLARESGDLKRAEQSYRQALAADASYADAQLNLAILYDQHLKRPKDALAAYQRYRDLAGKQDLRAAVWIAELETKLKPATATP